MIEWRKRGIEPAVMIENCARAVDIKRRPEFFRDAPEINIFAVKLAVAITKRMHARKCSGGCANRRIKAAKICRASVPDAAAFHRNALQPLPPLKIA